jgi:hypothetical protein
MNLKGSVEQPEDGQTAGVCHIECEKEFVLLTLPAKWESLGEIARSVRVRLDNTHRERSVIFSYKRRSYKVFHNKIIVKVGKCKKDERVTGRRTCVERSDYHLKLRSFRFALGSDSNLQARPASTTAHLSYRVNIL